MPNAAYAALMMQATEKLFRALADEERLRILNLLLLDKHGVCVCELVDTLRLPQYQVSRQLGVLRDAGLVAGEKRGTWVYYSIAPELPPMAGLSTALHPPVQRQDDRTGFLSGPPRDGGAAGGISPEAPIADHRNRGRLGWGWEATSAASGSAGPSLPPPAADFDRFLWSGSTGLASLARRSFS
jgi:DNA-binding transcriptional ArsR family regulator